MSEPRENPITVYVNTIKGEDMQRILLSSLPKTVPLEKFTSAVVSALRSAPQVFMDCDRVSVYNGIAEAARKGLIPDGKQGALVPFNTKVGDKWVKKCQFMIMPQGIIDSLAKIGITVYAQSVYKNDHFQFWSDDSGQHVNFNFQPFVDRGERIGAFACARTKDGTTYVEAINMDFIKRVMAVSKQKDKSGNHYGPWKEWPEPMEQKPALHKICKRLPTVEIGHDDEYKKDTVSLAARNEDNQKPTEEEKRTLPEGAEAKRPKALQQLVDTETGEITDAQFKTGETPPVEAGKDGVPF